MSTTTANQPLGPVPEDEPSEHEVSLYESHKKIHPRSVSGFFTRWRWAMVWITQIVFYGLPWLNWNGRQAILFDLLSRRFYLGGLVLYPQDFIYLTGLLVMAALSLFLFTAVAGRLWCGYACPQTVYTEIFLWIEHKVEGDRSARIRLDESPLSAQKLGKKSLKHGIWILFALWTGFTFVGYFTPIRELAALSLAASLGVGGQFVWPHSASWNSVAEFILLLEEGAQLQLLAEAIGGSRPYGPGVLTQQWTMSKLLDRATALGLVPAIDRPQA